MKAEILQIILLILHIILLALCAIASIISDKLWIEISYMVCSTLWGVVIGLDIANMIQNKINK